MSPASPDAIAAAMAYEALHVPALFRQWAPRVLDAARVQPGQRVLDVACGTGVLAREAAARVGPSGAVSGVDRDPGMLAVAQRLAPAVEWREATAESLPYRDGSFDAVVSQFGLMFFPDRRGALREMLRVLVPGGRIAVAVWDAIDGTPAYVRLVALFERVGGRPAADALRAPFALGDRAELARLFADAGVASAEIATQRGTARFPSVRTLVEADLRGWLPVMGAALDEERIQRILAEAEQVLAPYRTPQGDVAFDMPAIVASGAKA